MIPTIRAKPGFIDIKTVEYVGAEVLRNAQTFPTDYDFIRWNCSHVGYVCGMSVPPIMIKRLVTRLIEQGVFSYKGVG